MVNVEDFLFDILLDISNKMTVPAHKYLELLSSKHLNLAQMSGIDRLTGEVQRKYFRINTPYNPMLRGRVCKNVFCTFT